MRCAAAIGARVLVAHYEARSDNPAIEGQYRRGIERAAELAGEHHLILGIENIEVERSEYVLEFLKKHAPPVGTYDL